MSHSSTESNIFLKKFINQEGKVDYTSLDKDIHFQEKIAEIEQKKDLLFSSKTEELAFWLNTYNLLVLQGVLKQLTKNPAWKGTRSFFSRFKFFWLQKFTVGPQKLSLYTIENKFLRSKFKDPRIHFAINCASSSCPILPSYFFEKETVDQLLDQLTKNFITNTEHVLIDQQSNKILLNKIFKWYKEDFDEQGGIIEFIKQYKSDIPHLDNPTLSFFKYNWSLNAQS